MRRKYLTKEDVQFIHDNYHKIPPREIAKQLGVETIRVVQAACALRKREIDLPKWYGKRKNAIDEFVEELKNMKSG